DGCTGFGGSELRHCNSSQRVRRATNSDSSWGGRTRTSNFPINSRAVCQLTYTPNARQTKPRHASAGEYLRAYALGAPMSSFLNAKRQTIYVASVYLMTSNVTGST